MGRCLGPGNAVLDPSVVRDGGKRVAGVCPEQSRRLTFYLLSLGGNQRELARQKNMKKQSDSVKGKRRDDGLSAAARKQR